VASKLPEGIDPGRSRPDRDNVSTWLRRGVLMLLAVAVVAALANTFGQRPSTSQADSPLAGLSVTAPADVRGGLIFQVRVQIEAHQRMAAPALVFSPGWFESMTTNAIAPQPANQTSRNGDVEFQLPPIAAHRLATYWFYFQVNPTNVGWQRPETLELLNARVPVASIHRTITIYP
jgi:hypothetical protein